MSKCKNQKLKILLLMQILLEKTDEEHPLSSQQLILELERNGIEAERKSIYADIEALQEFGIDILNRKGKPSGYYVASRDFELPELKLLVDAVQSSKFITRKKSEELIKKLEGLTNRQEAVQLQRQVFVTNRIKTMNESIYYNVDKIHSAIYSNRKISFQYFQWDITKSMKLRKNGAKYEISPWALTWDDENYYMIGYDCESEVIKHYRVDKMLCIESMVDLREGKKLFERFDTAEYGKKTFGMFAGVETDVTLRCEESMIGVILDRFGHEITIRKSEEGYFEARVKVALSTQFFGWITGVGKQVEVIRPEAVRTEYFGYLRDILANE